MKLHDLTESTIKNFAGGVIFDRGHGYFVNNLVFDLQYDDDSDSIQAQVSGNYDDYEVNVSMENGVLSGDCTCPYEGYPCKHIVATLLTFLAEKEQYAQQATRRKKSASSLEKKVRALSKDELVQILMSCAKKYPDMKRDLSVRLEPQKKATFASIKTQINHAFPSVTSRNYSISSIVKQLRAILKSVEQADVMMQMKVNWAVTDRTLKELNDYGIDEESLENIAIGTMESLTEVFRENPEYREEKAEIIEQLMEYYIWGNCGLVDWIYETVMELCSEKSDYEIVIEKLEAKLNHASYKSYYQGLLVHLYAQIGDEDAQLKTLESHLQYGGDYWRLAQYWFEHGEDEKAWQIVQEGIEKGEGRKTELYDALQQRYHKEKNFARIFELLQDKIARKAGDVRRLKHDSTYQYLWQHYTAEADYEGQKRLLNLCLNTENIDLDLYQRAESALNEKDWPEFEAQMLAILTQSLNAKRQTMYGLISVAPAGVMERLAEIYAYKQDYTELFVTIRKSIPLLRKYEAHLLDGYAPELLDIYQQHIDRLIAQRGRKNYKAAVPFAETVRSIYLDTLKQPKKWTKYIAELKAGNKTLRAFQQEFAHL